MVIETMVWMKSLKLVFTVKKEQGVVLVTSRFILHTRNKWVMEIQSVLLLHNMFISFSFLKRFLIYFLFLERREGREKEKEGNINVRLPLAHPLLGTWP